MSKLVENYLLQEPVGKGVYGQVYRAVHQKNQGVFAVKVIPKASFRSNPKLEQLAINEINILSSIRHKNIVRFVETLKTPNNFYFVYEFCNEGTLESCLQKKKFMKESEALLYFRQLLEAFKELNKNNIMHRDLKPDNIFLSDGILKLGDFGFCKMLEVNMAQTMLGSPIYMAPEVLKQEIYTSKADIWSMGVVLFEMLFGYCPFESSSIAELMNKLKEAEVEIPHQINNISEEAEILLRKMLVKDQFKRIEWVDLFDFVIDDRGKIVQGCKKQFAIETLERYFFNSDAGSNKSNKNIPIDLPSSERIINKFNSAKQIDKKSSDHEVKKPESNSQKVIQVQRSQQSSKVIEFISNQKNNTTNLFQGNQQQQLFSSPNINIADSQEKKSPPYSYKNIKSSKDDSDVSTSFKQIHLRRPESMPSESPSKTKKEKFGEKHNQWLQAMNLLEDLALNSMDPKSQEICIFLLLKKILQRIEKQSDNYPEWTDVFIEERKSIKDSLQQMKNANSQLSRFLENQKENDYERKERNQLLNVWANARNKFTLERAIRAAYDRPSKDSSIEQILA